jgi:hypothetical protein
MVSYTSVTVQWTANGNPDGTLYRVELSTSDVVYRTLGHQHSQHQYSRHRVFIKSRHHLLRTSVGHQPPWSRNRLRESGQHQNSQHRYRHLDRRCEHRLAPGLTTGTWVWRPCRIFMRLFPRPRVTRNSPQRPRR